MALAKDGSTGVKLNKKMAKVQSTDALVHAYMYKQVQTRRCKDMAIAKNEKINERNRICKRISTEAIARAFLYNR